MTDDDWWTQAAERFGLDPSIGDAPASADADRAGPDEPPQPGRRRRHNGIEWLVLAVGAIAFALLLRAFVVQQFAVDGQSMLSSLHSGDRVLVNKLSYHLHDPRRGDVVVLEDVTGSVAVRDLIKRVIALPGETVQYTDCQLYVNGQAMAEPYLDPTLVTDGNCGDPQPLLEVEPGHVFVMGDNRAESLDSRTKAIGQIPIGHVVGRAFVVVWPRSDWRWL